MLSIKLNAKYIPYQCLLIKPRDKIRYTIFTFYDGLPTANYVTKWKTVVNVYRTHIHTCKIGRLNETFIHYSDITSSMYNTLALAPIIGTNGFNTTSLMFQSGSVSKICENCIMFHYGSIANFMASNIEVM